MYEYVENVQYKHSCMLYNRKDKVVLSLVEPIQHTAFIEISLLKREAFT